MQLTAVLFVLAFAGLAVAYPMPSPRNYGYAKPTDDQKSLFEEYFEAQSAPAPSSKQSAPGMAWPFGMSPDRDEEGEMAEIPNNVGGDSFQELARMNSFPYAQMQAPADEETTHTNMMEGAKPNYFRYVEEEQEEEEEEEEEGGAKMNYYGYVEQEEEEEEEEEEGNGGAAVGQEAFNQFMDNFLPNTDTDNGMDNVVDKAEEEEDTTGDKQAMGYWQQGNGNGAGGGGQEGGQEGGAGGGQAMGFWGRDEGNMFAQARPQPPFVNSMPEGDVNEYFGEMQRARAPAPGYGSYQQAVQRAPAPGYGSYQQAEAQDHLGPSRLQNFGELRDFADSQNGPRVSNDNEAYFNQGQGWGRREVETQDASEE